MSKKVRASKARLAALLVLALAAGSAQAETEKPERDALAEQTSRARLIRSALEKSPAMRAAAHREKAAKLRAKAANSLPDPELMLDVWQIPISRPYAVRDAGMVMLGVKQGIPAPGSLSARESATELEARVARAEQSEAARKLTREVGHAFADYLEATRQHHIHERHIGVAKRVLEVARARYAAGGMLTDVSQSEVELSRSRADAAGEEARLRSIKRRLNALASRAADAKLGPPLDEGLTTVALTASEIEKRALARRPDLEMAQAKRAAAEAEQRVADKEAAAPSFSLGGLYFPPMRGETEHGYGASFSMSLPWVWGGPRNRRAAQRESIKAAGAEISQARLDVGAEVASSMSAVESALERIKVLERETLPASRRNMEFSLTGYETGGTSLVTLVTAQRDVVDVELEIVMARAMLEHALTELDFAAGTELPRKRVALDTK
ncbi:MAG: TolC family protein [Myxococcales bacterium]|nr:TolC family protein [Myxococcales bacterium]